MVSLSPATVSKRENDATVNFGCNFTGRFVLVYRPHQRVEK